ncbi:beclin-1-like protein [Panicum miliaceum]|uniref:Beclin-1-like protein n=1 Tax=Panicum miliaceum TaxID=4540 RepID=A0A3L6R3C2_PANMI|nr:beclin-1-like protein [Panicum miliaceum]
MKHLTGGKSGAAGQSVPRLRCQECHGALAVVGVADRLPASGNNSGFFSSVTVLKRAFEIATSQTQVEQPLCVECTRVLSVKMDFEIEDIKSDIKAYEAYLQQLEQESYSILSETDFQEENQKIEEEERKLKADIEEAEKQYSEVSSEMKDLETKYKQFEESEERYWQEFNSFQLQLTSNQVEWDEINAAWVRLHFCCIPWLSITPRNFSILGTYDDSFLFKFMYPIKIHAVGSYPRITDINNKTHKLFGPANVLFSTQYDEAMTWFLTCLQEFVEFAVSLDKEKNVPPDKSFKLPYKIDGDKVGGYRVILGDFNTRENSTKALKNMLCNLKWVLYWFIGTTSFATAS